MWVVGLESTGVTPPLMSWGVLVAHKVSEPQSPRLRNWGTVRVTVTIRCALAHTTQHSTWHSSTLKEEQPFLSVVNPGSLARWPQFCDRSWRTRCAYIPSPVFAYR